MSYEINLLKGEQNPFWKTSKVSLSWSCKKSFDQIGVSGKLRNGFKKCQEKLFHGIALCTFRIWPVEMTRCVCTLLASQDAMEVMFVTVWVTNFTDVTLVSDKKLKTLKWKKSKGARVTFGLWQCFCRNITDNVECINLLNVPIYRSWLEQLLQHLNKADDNASAASGEFMQPMIYGRTSAPANYRNLHRDEI